MRGFRATSIAVSFGMWSGLALLAASHRISAVIPELDLAPVVPVVIDIAPPPPPPPPLPDVKRKPEPVAAPPTNLETGTPTPTPVTPLYQTPPTPAEITSVTWLKRPSAREFDRYYPARAAEREKEGQAVLNCSVNADGTINCAVASQTPEGWGFGEAAVQISRSFQMAPQTVNGAPTSGGTVRVPITFRLGR